MKLYVNNNLLSSNITLAENFKTKLIGLLNKKSLDKNEGLLLKNCSGIHCFFMEFTIEAVYLSKDMKVLYKETVKPWRIGKFVRNCTHVLELPEGMAKDIEIGDYIILEEKNGKRQ
jgi:uncharacterized membrane protein (UPF0127 family)